MLRSKRILVGVTAGIAAYKIPFLIRLLIKEGAEVQVVMSKAAAEFVAPITLATLSKNPVHTDFINEEEGKIDWNNHVELGLWADLMIVAPATANTLAKMANGQCDNLLLATYFSAKSTVFFAPAMDLDMYAHPTAQASIEKLKSFGNIEIPAEEGELASGLEGKGRMAEPATMVTRIKAHLASEAPLRNQTVLLTAGPTREPIDPVRFLSNRSTGTMGYALAAEAAKRGARVILVSGPSSLSNPNPAIELIRVETAAQMLEQCLQHFEASTVFIASAAVADYRPEQVHDQKVKKKAGDWSIGLERTADILKTLSDQKSNQYLVGFALESENGLENAQAKLERKKLDAIVLNTLKDAGAGFGAGTNKVTFLDNKKRQIPFELKPKAAVAEDIWNEIQKRLDEI